MKIKWLEKECCIYMERKVAFYPDYIHITNTNKSNILFFEYSCSPNLK